MAVLRDTALVANKSFSANAAGDGDDVTSPRALFDRKNQDTTCKFGLTEDQQTEVSMLMGAREVDFNLLRRCHRNTEVAPRRVTRNSSILRHQWNVSG